MSIAITECNAENSVCCLEVPNILLYDWYIFRRPGDSYINKINPLIAGQALMIKTYNQRVNAKASRIKNKIERATKRQRQKIKSQTSKLTIFQNEVVSPIDIHWQAPQTAIGMKPQYTLHNHDALLYLILNTMGINFANYIEYITPAYTYTSQ